MTQQLDVDPGDRNRAGMEEDMLDLGYEPRLVPVSRASCRLRTTSVSRESRGGMTRWQEITAEWVDGAGGGRFNLRQGEAAGQLSHLPLGPD